MDNADQLYTKEIVETQNTSPLRRAEKENTSRFYSSILPRVILVKANRFVSSFPLQC